MVRRVIEISLEATDNFSGVLNKGLSGLGVGIGAAVTTSIISGISDGLRGAGDLFERQLTKALNLETSLIGGGGAFANFSLFGSDLESNITAFANVFKNLEKIAADLPGTTEDYLEILNQTSATLAKGGLNNENDIANAVRDFGLLQQAGKGRGLLPKDVARGVEAFVGGKSFKELKSKGIELFAKGGAFQSILEEIINLEGEAKSESGRLNQLIKAAQRTVDPTGDGGLIKLYKESYSSLVEGIKTRLFGSDGIFSFSKDVFPNQSGNQSILGSFQNLIHGLFGNGGVIQRLFGSLGFDENTIGQNIYKFIQFLNKLVYNFNVGNLSSTIKDYASLFNKDKIVGSIGSFINKSIDDVAAFLRTTDGKALVGAALDLLIIQRSAMGRLKAQTQSILIQHMGKLVKLQFAELFGYIAGMFQSPEGVVAGLLNSVRGIIKAIIGLFGGLGKLLQGNLGTAITTGLIYVFRKHIFIGLTKVAARLAVIMAKLGIVNIGAMMAKFSMTAWLYAISGQYIKGIQFALSFIFKQVVFIIYAIKNIVIAKMAGFFATLGTLALPVTLIVAAIAIWGKVAYDLWKNWDDFKVVMAWYWDSFVNAFKSVMSGMKEKVFSATQAVMGSITNLLGWITNQLNRIPGVNIGSANTGVTSDPIRPSQGITSQNVASNTSNNVTVNINGTNMNEQQLVAVLNRWSSAVQFS